MIRKAAPPIPPQETSLRPYWPRSPGAPPFLPGAASHWAQQDAAPVSSRHNWSNWLKVKFQQVEGIALSVVVAAVA
jgi:hypothetical protein